MAVNEELKNLIELIKFSNKINQSEIANKIGIKSTYLSDMINGRVPFSAKFKNSLYELYSDCLAPQRSVSNEEIPNNNSSMLVPLLPLSAQGGTLNDFVVSAKECDCEKIVSPIKAADYAISVAGDSMSPEYPSGSQVLIKKINERAFIDWGKTYVLDTENGTIIKKLMPAKEKDRVLCVSINPAYPSFEVAFQHIFGVYRVLMCMSVK